MPGDTVWDFTCAVGAAEADVACTHGTEWHDGNAYMATLMESTVSTDGIYTAHAYCARLGDKAPDELLYHGSGWGALEKMRIEAQGDRPFPESVCFPVSTIGPEQYPWVTLLQTGVLPELSPESVPLSWMTGPKWYRLIEESTKREGGRHWFSLLHLGVALYELTDTTKIATEAAKWEHRSACNE